MQNQGMRCLVDELEPYYVAAIARCHGMGGRRARALCEAVGSGKEVWEAKAGDLSKYFALAPENVRQSFHKFRQEQQDFPQRLAEVCGRDNIRVITIWQPEYPDILKEIYEPPAVLYIKGRLETEAVRTAMVGSRKYTSYGEAVAMEFAEKLAAAGLTVVSGGARGIDTCSHQGALRSVRKGTGGRTVAVLGCGVDVAYPRENRRLFEEIADMGGAVISEYAPGTQPLPAFFPARNRIIAGLAQGTLVVEAAQRSGSLITAELALNSGRDVYAVPGSIYAPMSEGCHRLIQQGAKLVQAPADILEDYGVEAKPLSKPQKEMPPEQKRVWQVLSFEHPLTIDEIVESLPDGEVSALAFTLLQMEMEGLVQENERHAYRKMERE